jgi:hypothetical protein
MDNPKPVTIEVELTDEEAYALAQYLKRAIFEDYRKRALNDDDAYIMQGAVAEIRKALAKAGYEPR